MVHQSTQGQGCKNNMKIKLKKNINYKQNFWDIVKNKIDELISVDISSKVKDLADLDDRTKIIFLSWFIFAIFLVGWITYICCSAGYDFSNFVEPILGPVTDIISFFWNLYCKLWESLGFDTTSRKVKESMTMGVGIFIQFLFLLLGSTYSDDMYKNDIKFRKFYNISLFILFIILFILLAFMSNIER